MTGARRVCYIRERGSPRISGEAESETVPWVSDDGGLRWARGVGYVLIVPATNRPVLRGDTFVAYFQLVTNPEL